MDQSVLTYLAGLSKLNFTGEELERTAAEMSKIIELMDSVKEADLVYDPKAEERQTNFTDLREDIPGDSMNPNALLQNAEHTGSCFTVPKVVE